MKKIIKENLVFIVIIVVVGILFNIKLPYYIDTPGGIIDISDRIETEEGTEINGSLNMLYVSEYTATIPTYLLSFIIKDWDLEKISDEEGDISTEDIYTRGKIMLNNSIQNAKYVAYTASSNKIEIVDTQNIVIATTSLNDFKIGDVILTICDEEINSLSDIKEIINTKELGEIIKVKVLRNNEEIEINAEVGESNGNKIIGIVVISNYSFETDTNITINFKSSESGSSGGLMMAIAIYNAISNEDIIKGRNIAGTGTISMDGTVGEIDGVKYKIIAAYKNNMDIVLVPEENYDEAIKVKEEKGYDMEIISISTFDEAIEYLRNS